MLAQQSVGGEPSQHLRSVCYYHCLYLSPSSTVPNPSEAPERGGGEGGRERGREREEKVFVGGVWE
jgi:hypothetical protein